MTLPLQESHDLDDVCSSTRLRAQCKVDSNLTVSLRFSGGVDKYPAKAHARRVADGLKASKGLIIISATKNVNWPNSDMPSPFRQDRYFYYLTGCNEPDCYVTYNIQEDTLTLWLPPVDNNWRHVVYYGNGSTTEQALEMYDIDEAKYIKPQQREGPSLEVLLSRCWEVDATYPPTQCQKGMPLPLEEYESKTSIPLFSERVLRTAMDAARVIKDEHEIDLIRKANDITAAAHISVLKGMHTFNNEAQVEAAYMQTCIAEHAKEQAYDVIAGSGPNAAILHYSQNLDDFTGQTVVLDAGCEVERYASDVTRTIPINKKNPGHWPSKEAEEIYKIVEHVQESCIKQLLPGNKYIEITWHAHHLVIDGLLKLGILKGDPEDIFHAGTSMAFLPHGLGHHVGLDVHDVSPVPPPPICPTEASSRLEALRRAYVKWKPDSASYVRRLGIASFAISPQSHALESPDAPELEPGMVVTVEPGIYFNSFLLKRFLKDPQQIQYINADVLRRYIPVGGVRIEDDVLVTKNGYVNLTTAPKGAKMLEVIREAARTT